ncbi:MAG: glycoside hydrolase family 20 zincin-like fold domain-containing protein [Cyclobacteriaceae bacterium]
MSSFSKSIKTLLFLCFLHFSTAFIQAQDRFVPIIPNPQQVERSGQPFLHNTKKALTLFVDKNTNYPIDQLLDAWEEHTTLGLKLVQKPKDTEVRLLKHKKAADNPSFAAFIEPLLDFQKREAYQIAINAEGIVVHSTHESGAYYAVQSLKQLLRAYGDENAIPGMIINDYPDLEIRGMMDDISRGPVPTHAYMKQQIERLSEMKINLLTYYTEHVVKTEKHAAFAPKDGGLTIAEWRSIADYAKKYNIDLVGNFQSFGHFEKILSHPDYSHLGEGGTLLSPSFEESYELLDDIYTEMIPAFHSDYFHINSDETFDLGAGASKARVDSLGESAVYAEHINRIYDLIDGKGKKMLMWGDIILNDPTILDRLPDDVLPITWGYDVMESYTERITTFLDRGYNPLISTGILNSHSIIPDFEVAKGNIGGFLAEGKRLQAWGMLNTVWDDGGSALFSRDWYGVAYAAEQSWNSDTDDQTYDARFNKVLYGNDGLGISRALNAINELTSIKSTEKMNEAVFWQQILPDSGKSMLTNLEDWAEVEALAQKADAYLAEVDATYYAEDLAYIQLTIDQYRFLATSRPTIVEIAELYKSAYLLQQDKENQEEARSLLVQAFGKLKVVIDNLTILKAENQHLWLLENRSYSLDLVEERYDMQLSDFYDVERKLRSALSDFDSEALIPEPAAVRLDIQKTDNWYFKGWLMTEPMPTSNGANNPQFDALTETGGLSTTFPNVTEEFFFNSEKYRWKRVNTPLFGQVNLHELFADTDQKVMHAFAHIDAKSAQRVRLLVGSTDGVDVYLNGEKVHEQFGARPYVTDQDELFLDLKEGRNHLMLRLAHDTGDWVFSVTMPDVEFASSKNRYRIVD